MGEIANQPKLSRTPLSPEEQAERIAQLAMETLEKRAKTKVYTISVIVAVVVAALAWLGFSTVADIRKQAATTVENEVEKQVAEKADSIADLRDQLSETTKSLADLEQEHREELIRRAGELEGQFRVIESQSQQMIARLENREAELNEIIAATRRRFQSALRDEEFALRSRAVTDEERAFLRQADAFAAALGFETERPEIVFGLPADAAPGDWAVWDHDRSIYYVSPRKLRVPGMAEHVAVMSRVFQATVGCPDLPGRFFEDFRHSVDAYLLESEGVELALYEGKTRRIQSGLNKLVAAGTPKSGVREFVVRLVDNYECTWDFSNFAKSASALVEPEAKIDPRIVERVLEEAILESE